MRWTTHFTVPTAPAGSNGWQLKVFVKNQSSAQLFVDGLATAQRRVNLAAYGVAVPTAALTTPGGSRSSRP